MNVVKSIHHFLKIIGKALFCMIDWNMNLFAVDELGPTQKALEEAEENEKGFKQQWR